MKPSTWRYILFLVAFAAALLPYLSLSLPNPAGLDAACDTLAAPLLALDAGGCHAA
jgi:hypothetical protein